ncbi:DUF5682 family protein [Mycobacteroides franklinii]|uniref:ChaN family lipoprotein n=1 Tax=Mycobacteroides franklinii TaxID=948102 RepID=A0A4R5PAZ8_9MYCO|nr:DUF5682 family protein [Mycobacteroides franklinii]ORA59718.1 hypothetical protein BST24_16300 [Mycobacteroides franklinii]TDH21006.1 hypothetical protein EJ571_13610 [Mycobacteroides franklinii]
MTVHFIGVRHHSPACARLVSDVIHNVSPAYVLVEGSADFNDRIDELLLGHRLPIALFSFLTGPDAHRMIWAPFCDYSPEWVALTAAKAVGAEFRFIDLPAWHHAFEERTNRYSDADARHVAVTSRLCAEFGMDNNDVLWDHLVEVPGAEHHTLARYFDTLRGDARAGDSDAAREEYMAQWICAAQYFAGGRPIVVVTGGFHRPALISLTAERDDLTQWPAVPAPPAGHRVGNYLIPYSYRRLDAFSGYQSGMPSPGYYHHVWHDGAETAGQRLIADVAGRLRERHVPVSTADLIAAQSLSEGLARLRGHSVRARTDILDGLAVALITEDLPSPLPWAARGVLQTGTHPAVLEMLAALTGTAHGELHPDTPLPPLIPDVERLLAEHDLTPPRDVRLNLTVEADLDRSRILNRLRVLGIPGFERSSGPTVGTDPATTERWELQVRETQLPKLLEAGAHGATLGAAVAHVLRESVADGGTTPATLGPALFDAVLCGSDEVLGELVPPAAQAIADSYDLGGLGTFLSALLALWRHDWIYQVRQHDRFPPLIAAAVRRIEWLAESARARTRDADRSEVAALSAVCDALTHAGETAALDRPAFLGTMERIGRDPKAPPDLRGAALGARWRLDDEAAVDPVDMVRAMSMPETLGDFLIGVFGLAREQVLHTQDGSGFDVLTAVDHIVEDMTERDFLSALPAVRQAFEYFPPRERTRIADRILVARGRTAAGRAFVRTESDPALLAYAATIEERVESLLSEAGLNP